MTGYSYTKCLDKYEVKACTLDLINDQCTVLIIGV